MGERIAGPAQGFGRVTEVLKRRIGPWLLTAYGVGVMVGAGIYVLVGLVAQAAGLWAPLAFLLAGAVALPSALSYAELSTRMPEAAGEVAFVENGFRSRVLALMVGLLIVVSGVISGAAVLRGGVGYLMTFVDLPEVWLLGAGAAVLTLVAVIGVLESLTLVALFTVLEVAGLLLVVYAGFTGAPVAEWSAPPAPDWSGIFGAVALCFFAFIGFEDIENMAEEVRDPSRTMPRSILLALVITAVLYALVTFAAVRIVPSADLGASEQPLALVWGRGTGSSAVFLSAIAVAAALNGVLAQIVMAARVVFGLGRRAQVLSVFTHAHPRFGTPVLATVLVGAAMLGAALALPIGILAEVTAVVLLGVFLLVNTSLILIKRRQPDAPFLIPTFVPYAGLGLTLAALILTGGVL